MGINSSRAAVGSTAGMTEAEMVADTSGTTTVVEASMAPEVAVASET